MNKCLVCVRIPPKIVAIYAHKVFGESQSSEIIHKIITDTCEAINYADRKNRIPMCGKPQMGIIAGFFYWLTYRYNCRVTQRDIAFCFPPQRNYLNKGEGSMTEVCLRNNIYWWVKHYRELIEKEIKLQQEDYRVRGL